MSLRVVTIQPGDRKAIAGQIREIEFHAVYPFGEESFRIDHGVDYFRFFDRLGKVSYYCVMDGQRLAAVAAAILRPVPFKHYSEFKKCWYLCDLKVHPDYRGKRLPLLLFRRAVIPALLRARRGYAISMNGAGPNRVASILRNAPIASMAVQGILNFYSLSADEVRSHRSLIEKHRGAISFLCLQGIKDLIMTQSGLPMPLAHFQFGPSAADIGTNVSANPIDGFRHMIVAPATDDLALDFARHGVPVGATATILAYRMNHADFRFILSSDI